MLRRRSMSRGRRGSISPVKGRPGRDEITEYGAAIEMRDVAVLSIDEMFEELEAEDVQSMSAESLGLHGLTPKQFVTHMCGALRNNTTLTSLSLASNGLNSLMVEHIGEAIKDHPKLRHISFRDNEITTKGANKFSRAAQTNKVLMHVDFDENSIGPAFPMDIFLMSGVKKVEMYKNMIENIPARIMSFSFEDLDVRHNRIDVASLKFAPPSRWLMEGQVLRAEYLLLEQQQAQSEVDKQKKRMEEREESRKRAMLEKGRRRRMSIENVVAARRVSVFGDTALGMQEAAQAGLAHPLDGPRKHEVQLLPGGYPPPPERHAQVGLLAPPPVEADAGVQGENNGRGSSLEESSLSWGDDLSDDEGGIRQI